MAFTMFAIYLLFSIYIFATCARSKFVQIHFFVPCRFSLKSSFGDIVSALSLEGERTVSFSRQSRLFHYPLRWFDTVFQRPYRYFSIVLKVVYSLSDRYKIFTSNWLWIEICENVVLSKINITMTTINKKLWNW